MKLKYNVSILSEAEVDLDTAYIWYERQLIGLGDKFFDSVNTTVLSIARSPFIYEEIYKGVRRSVMNKFPYGIYYKVLTDSAEIQILGVVHFKRSPRIIRKRL